MKKRESSFINQAKIKEKVYNSYITIEI